MKLRNSLLLLSKLVDVEYLVADDSVIQAVFNKVFPDAIRQYCIFHIKKNIKKAFHVPKLMKLSDEAILSQRRDFEYFQCRNQRRGNQEVSDFS